jgi:hypothetical protein
METHNLHIKLPCNERVPSLTLETGVIYGSYQSDDPHARSHLQAALTKLLPNPDMATTISSIWSLTFSSHRSPTQNDVARQIETGHVIKLPTRLQDIAVQDEILDDVELLWKAILGPEANGLSFMRFDQREAEQEPAP